MQKKGHFVDIDKQMIYPAEITIENGVITDIEAITDSGNLPYILPGFIDAHVHIESSMLTPSQFARLAVVHGTVATVSDPHEIANVCGVSGVEYMLKDAKRVPFHFCFGAPSCVPATPFETAGAELNVDDVAYLLKMNDIGYLSEMMNFPGVLLGDSDVMAKIAAAQKAGKPVDGHAPGLRGADAAKYIKAGISTDHECFTEEEAVEKLALGMKVLIREGSAAKNFHALIHLLKMHPEEMMFCSDDKHPDSLVEGHINQLCARAVAAGVPVMHVLKAACVNPVKHYNLKSGLLRVGDAADFIVVNNVKEFRVEETYLGGMLVAENGKSLLPVEDVVVEPVNNFKANIVAAKDFVHTAQRIVIKALDGQLITEKYIPDNWNGSIDIKQDIIKIAVINRYQPAKIATAFIHNTGLKFGALASSVAHDSHNIVVVGTNDSDMANAANAIIAARGGVSVAHGDTIEVLPLPVAGLMSDDDGYDVAQRYAAIDKAAKALGTTLSAPFMTLSFMALLVIPHVKLSDKGLFDGDTFRLYT